MLFCAAQAPELFGRDQRHGVLPLYFSRVLTRIDYALARAGGLFLADLRDLDRAAAHPDASARSWRPPTRSTGLRDDLPDVPRYLARVPLLASALLGGGRRRSSPPGRRGAPTPRPRSSRCSSSRRSSSRSWPSSPSATLARVLVLASPSDILDGVNAAVFDDRLAEPDRRRGGPAGLDVLVAAVVETVALRRPRPAPLPRDHRVTATAAGRLAGPAHRAGAPAPRRRPRGPGDRARARLALVRQRRGRQRHLVRPRAGRDRPARPERRRQVDAAPPPRRAAGAVRRRGPDRRPAGLRRPVRLPRDGPRPGARGRARAT